MINAFKASDRNLRISLTFIAFQITYRRNFIFYSVGFIVRCSNVPNIGDSNRTSSDSFVIVNDRSPKTCKMKAILNYAAKSASELDLTFGEVRNGKWRELLHYFPKTVSNPYFFKFEFLSLSSSGSYR